MFRIEAKQIGSYVEQTLAEHKIGRVHSVFNTSFNLIFGERLIHIGSVDQGLAPFGVGLVDATAKQLTKLVGANERVVWRSDESAFVFQRGVYLQMEAAKRLKQRRLSISLSDDALTERRHIFIDAYRKSATYFGLCLSKEESDGLIDILSKYQYEPTKKVALAETTKRLLQLCDLLSSGETGSYSCEELCQYFVGRGPGLTPSGDDLLTGICAMLSILTDGTHPFIQQFAAYLAKEGKKRTTAVAYEYLRYVAKEQAFHSSIDELLQTFVDGTEVDWRHAIQNLQQMGHTSGIDTLLGMIVVLCSFSTS